MKHRRPDVKAMRNAPWRCPGCNEIWCGNHCCFCDEKTPLPDKLVVARLQAGQSCASAAAGAGLTVALLTAAELGRQQLLPEELTALAETYRVAPGVFGVVEYEREGDGDG